MSAQATLNLGVPQASGNVTLNLLVTSGNSSDTETRTILHQPAISNQWFDLGVLTADARTLVVGDRVNVRTVSTTGQDAFWPATAITITSAIDHLPELKAMKRTKRLLFSLINR
jgi:formate-dependent nitrite reductase membrane component NrfD